MAHRRLGLFVWESTPPVHDGAPALIWDAAISQVQGPGRALVYVPARRGGVLVLEFTPFETVVFRRAGRICVPEFATSVSALPGQAAGADALLVSSYGGGVRVFDKR